MLKRRLARIERGGENQNGIISLGYQRDEVGDSAVSE